jgi:hypothetical protein
MGFVEIQQRRVPRPCSVDVVQAVVFLFANAVLLTGPVGWRRGENKFLLLIARAVRIQIQVCWTLRFVSPIWWKKKKKSLCFKSR